MDRSANMTSTANLRVITNTVTGPMRVQCRKRRNHSRHPPKAPPHKISAQPKGKANEDANSGKWDHWPPAPPRDDVRSAGQYLVPYSIPSVLMRYCLYQ